MMSKNFKNSPKFKHNLWLTPSDNPEITYLTVSNGVYEVPTNDAMKFLGIRTYCTGYNSIEDISKKTNMPESEIISLITPLVDLDILHPTINPKKSISDVELKLGILNLAKLFGEQLAETSISII